MMTMPRQRRPKVEVQAALRQLGDPSLPDKVIDARPPSNVLLGPEVEDRPPAAEKFTRARNVQTGFKANAYPPQEGGLEYYQIPAGEDNDRRCQDIFDFAQRALQRRTIDARVQQALDSRIKPPEDITAADIMYTLALYGGRIEVKNFGTFYVKELPGYWKFTKNQKQQYFVPGRRVVQFFPSEVLKSLTNEDYYSQSISEPTPNKSFFVERRNMILE
jgi:nucleoid DNA-binding protein